MMQGKLRDKMPSLLLPGKLKRASLLSGATSSQSAGSSAEDITVDNIHPPPRSGSVDFSSPSRRRASSLSTGIRLSTFEIKLDLTLIANKAAREEVLGLARKQFAEESILFFIAIREWEQGVILR